MTQRPDQLTFTQKLQLHWNGLLSSVLHLWVKAQVLPDEDGQTGVPPGPPVCYVLADYSRASLLILDKACIDLGIDRPLLPISTLEAHYPRAYACLRRMRGLFVQRPDPRRSSEMLARLVEFCDQHPGVDIQLVPVTVLVGRAPDKVDGFAKVLFSESWEVIGRFRRFMSTIMNGRDTVVQFSKPISLLELSNEGLGAPRSVRKVSRLLRTHFRLVKSAMIGPDLSHRRTMIDSVLQAPAVQDAIKDKAGREGISEQEAGELALEYALEITANYSYGFVRIAYFLLNWFLQKVYGETRVYHFERFKREALDHTIIYVPCHRSHADYILISFLLYVRGLAVPHIAAGVNLNLPVVGSLLRKGGAFYLRRTFRSQKLYSAVFSEYVSHILAQGMPIEYFIEGTRSRTGRLLPPKGGMLAMTIRAYLRQPVKPVMFQPVYIGYEKLLEGSSYTHELSGKAKEKESLGDLLKVHKLLKQNHGEAHVSFGQPVFLDDLLTEFDADWRDKGEPDDKPSWMTPMVNTLGDRIMRSINASADVNPVNLLATILLSTPRHSMGEIALRDQVTLYQALLRDAPLGAQITITERDPIEVVGHGFDLGLLTRVEHQLGDIIRLVPEQAVGMTYFRNNTAHLFALPSLIACCFLRQRSITRAHLQRIVTDIYPFLRAELYLPWPEEQAVEILNEYLDVMARMGLLSFSESRRSVLRAEGGTREAGQVNLLARSLLTTLERYYITLAVLAKNGSGSLNRLQLERLCILTAQRISLLQEFDAPEFYDRSLFRQFIQELRRREVLVGNEHDRLEFDERLARMSNDARLFLEKGIRHGIIEVAPQALSEAQTEPDAATEAQ